MILMKKCNTSVDYKVKIKLSNMVTAVGLPLLIVNGKFQSLGSMTVEDLETFIPFLVKCSINGAGAQLINGVPEWWSSAIQYKFPLKKPNGLSRIGYHKHLTSIVCNCYWYHDAQYLLPFCAKIASNPESVFLKSNEDNTTSIFYGYNTCHIMKFNNENKYYDYKTKKEKPSLRSLLSALPKKSNNILDIYLCENCDAELFSQSEMQRHEKECYKEIINDTTNEHKTGNNCSITINKKIEDNSVKEAKISQHINKNFNSDVGKIKLFNYLKIQPINSENINRLSKSRNHCNIGPQKNGYLTLSKIANIEFSSILGRKLFKSSKQELKSKIKKNFKLIESFCKTNSSNRPNREIRELIEFKDACKKINKRTWTHQYSFNKKQRRSRYLTLKTGLNNESRRLLRQCKRLQINLTRLNIDFKTNEREKKF